MFRIFFISFIHASGMTQDFAPFAGRYTYMETLYQLNVMPTSEYLILRVFSKFVYSEN